jgi:hypothetical protein
MRTFAAALLLALAAPAFGQANQPARQDPLRGPQVRERPARRTLVERDLSGHLQRPDVPPEEAAIDLLGLDAEAKARVDQILAARAAILDQIVTDNIDLISRFANARQAGDRAEQFAALEELSKKLQPLNARGKLGDELRAALPPEKTRDYDNLVSEYRRAAVDADMAEAQARGERLTRLQANLRENLASLGLQIKRSYERTIAAKAADFEQLIGQLNLTPEQDSKIRGFVTQFVQDTKGRPTQEQRRSLFFRIMGELDRDQQKKLMAAYIGGPGPG